MGLPVQQQSQRETNSTPIPPPMPKNSKSSSNNKKNRNSQATKFVGVRQRPSGKWVAEIKNTTQKIRMWLGTYDSAEEAARAYDAAAFLLRGSKTRSNFVPSVASTNSPLSLKIKNLLMRKRGVVKPETPVGSSEDDQLCGWSRGEGASCCSEDELKDWVGGFEVGSRLLDRSGIDDDDQGKLRMASDPTDDGLWDLPHLYQLFFHS